MRGGRFGSKAGRVAVVVALVLGTLAVGTTAASASTLTQDGSGSTIGQVVESSLPGVVTVLDNEWT
jgi:hypothetical protein